MLQEDDVLNTLYGTDSVELHARPDGTESAFIVRNPGGYWRTGDRWGHRGFSAVLVVKNLHPGFIGKQQHTIWEHPDPKRAVDPFPLGAALSWESRNG